MIKTCLDDDWAPDLRFAACNLMEKLLISLNELIESEELRELYPALLQRLDDAQDLIRIEISKAFLAFFACKQVFLFLIAILNYEITESFNLLKKNDNNSF